jgi:aminomethyltransferase
VTTTKVSINRQGHANIPRRSNEPEGKAPYYYSQKKAGAVFGRRGGWEQPFHYGDPISEHHIIRNTVGLIDSNSQAEIYIEGKEALLACQRIFSRDVDVPIGKGVFSCILQDNGGAIDDAIVFRLAKEKWLSVSTTAGRHNTVNWIKDHIRKWDLSAVATDMTDALSYMEIQGPRSREVVQELIDTDVSNIALQFHHCKEAKIAGVAGLIARCGYTGELGFEFYVPSQYGEWVWDRSCDVVMRHDGRPAGVDALVSCAFEKGFTIMDVDYGRDTTPLDGNVPFVVSFDKPYDFIGKQALLNQKMAGTKKRIMGFQVEDSNRFAEPEAPIIINGKVVGMVFWGRPALTLGLSIGRCVVPTGTELGTKITIMNSAGPLEAVTHSRYFYDVQHERMCS